MNRYFRALLIVSVVIFQHSCAKKHTEDKIEKLGEKMIEVPCNVSQSKEYGSDKNTFRASGIGESLDQQTSKTKAITNARAELAKQISATIKGTIDNYVNSRELNNKEEIEERFESLTRDVINQQLNDVSTICEKQALTSENKYKTYICVEMSKESLSTKMNDKLSKDEKLRIDYDYEKFKQTLEKEMEKFDK